MSQFMLVERGIDTSESPEVLLSRIDEADDFLRNAATEFFGDWRECRQVTDVAGSGESLIDDVCAAQMSGTEIEKTTFVRYLRALVESGVRFIIWHGSDSSNLPTAQCWSDVLGLLRSQTRIQPADVFLRFVPPGGSSA